MLEFELIGKQKIVTEININDLTLQPLDLQTEDISEIGFWENTSGNTSFRFLWAGEAIDITIE
jgi:hypothetical protein